MSVEIHFTSLSKRQTMLLLAAVTFGGQDCLTAFDYLNEAEGEALKHRAQGLLQIPKERRIPLLATEMKRLVMAIRGALWVADPAKLAEAVANERPAVVELLLRAFPAALAEAVRLHLPASFTHKRSPQNDVRPEILHILRWKTAEMLERAGARRAHFKFSDVLRLPSRELLTLCDQVGARGLAHAIAGLPEKQREAFFMELSPVQRQLAVRYVAAAGSRKLPEGEARQALSPHLDKGPPWALRSAGAQRLARACLAQSAEFAARLLEKYRGEFGALLARWIREERPKLVNRGDGGRSEIVGEMERLEVNGLISKPVSLPPPPPRIAVGSHPPLPKPPLSFSRSQSGGKPALAPPRLARDWVAERAARKAGAVGRWADKAETTAPMREQTEYADPQKEIAEQERANERTELDRPARSPKPEKKVEPAPASKGRSG